MGRLGAVLIASMVTTGCWADQAAPQPDQAVPLADQVDDQRPASTVSTPADTAAETPPATSAAFTHHQLAVRILDVADLERSIPRGDWTLSGGSHLPALAPQDEFICGVAFRQEAHEALVATFNADDGRTRGQQEVSTAGPWAEARLEALTEFASCPEPGPEYRDLRYEQLDTPVPGADRSVVLSGTMDGDRPARWTIAAAIIGDQFIAMTISSSDDEPIDPGIVADLVGQAGG